MGSVGVRCCEEAESREVPAVMLMGRAEMAEGHWLCRLGGDGVGSRGVCVCVCVYESLVVCWCGGEEVDLVATSMAAVGRGKKETTMAQ